MDFREVRQKFLAYFRAHGHEMVGSSSLLPKDDPTLLFTNSGMVQFKRVFLGEEKRVYTRAVTSQKCVRAGGKHNDLDNVGYTARHHTFFEMLGNFSFGDYFKEEAIEWGWELLTDGYNLPSDNLYVTIYKDDDEAHRIWTDKIGVPEKKIFRLGEKDNFWAMGDTGPCGPCSEIHLDQGPSVGCGEPDCAPGCDCDRYLEIWNLVFTQFDRAPDGTLTPLPRPNIDTGMGLERLTAVVQGVTSNYDTDIFRGLISTIENLSERAYGEDERQDVAFRVVSDHARAAAFLIGDGIMPSNEGRGYVLRRIIRRAIRFGQLLDLKDSFLSRICGKVIEVMGLDYTELLRSRGFIEGVVSNEERRFADTLQYGMRVLNEEMDKIRAKGGDNIPGDVAFKLYDTFGLSVDIVEDVARDEALNVDMEGYERAMSKQRLLSQESWRGSGEEEIPEAVRSLMARGITPRFLGYETLISEGKILSVLSEGKERGLDRAGSHAEVVLDQSPFYGQAGGQVGDTGWLLNDEGLRFRVTNTFKYDQDLIVHSGRLESGSLVIGQRVEARVDEEKRDATALNHSATHLLHAALREVLGDHVKQAGSLVSPERLRFDFSHFAQVSSDKLMEVEQIVNRHIRANLLIQTSVMSREEAMKTGATAIFEERYGDRVRLVRVGDGVSMELCGGTHTRRTGNIGLFRIIGEGSVAANVRRIEALTGEEALQYDQRQGEELRSAAGLLKATPDKVAERLGRLLGDLKDKEKEIEALKARFLSRESDDFLSGVKEIGGIRVISREIGADSQKQLRETADKIRDKLRSGIILLGSKSQGKAMLTCVVTKDLTGRFNAGEIIRNLAGIVGGKGGGRPDMAQGGGGRPEKLGDALGALFELIEKGGN
jgi:alanyl-tRNA synthetase